MCARPFCAAGETDYCCFTAELCKEYGGIRQCERPRTFEFINI